MNPLKGKELTDANNDFYCAVYQVILDPKHSKLSADSKKDTLIEIYEDMEELIAQGNEWGQG